MIDRLKAPITVTVTFNHRTRKPEVKSVVFDGQEYPIKRVTYRHNERKGRTMLHTFAVVGSGTMLKIVFDSDSLLWTLEEIRSYEFDIAVQPKSLDRDARRP